MTIYAPVFFYGYNICLKDYVKASCVLLDILNDHNNVAVVEDAKIEWGYKYCLHKYRTWAASMTMIHRQSKYKKLNRHHIKSIYQDDLADIKKLEDPKFRKVLQWLLSRQKDDKYANDEYFFFEELEYYSLCDKYMFLRKV